MKKTATHKNLTATNIRYLVTMRELDQSGRGVRSVELASALGVSKPSIHNMMDTLIERGLIQKNAYGSAAFTDIGSETALRYSRYFASVAAMLCSSFPNMEDVRSAAFALLSEIPESCLAELCERQEPNAEA